MYAKYASFSKNRIELQHFRTIPVDLQFKMYFDTTIINLQIFVK